MIVICDTCSILMLLRIVPDLFIDPKYEAVTTPGVFKEFTRTQKFKDKYPWREGLKGKIKPLSANSLNKDEFKFVRSTVSAMLDGGVENTRTQRLFDLSPADKDIVALAISSGHQISTGDQPIIDFTNQEFSDEFSGNLHPLELINKWLSSGLITWDDSKHSYLEDWSRTEERPQPGKAKSDFKKLTGKPYPGP